MDIKIKFTRMVIFKKQVFFINDLNAEIVKNFDTNFLEFNIIGNKFWVCFPKPYTIN